MPIIPHLWYDKEARQAAEFYVSLFPGSKVTQVNTLKDTPSGDCDTVSFELAGQPLIAISAGPYFKLNPSISFILNFDPGKDPQARAKLDEVWAKLAEGGQVLMPLDKYFFSERYGWIQDRWGLSWQLILSRPEGEERPFITPSLLFTQAMAGRAEEALELYASIFQPSRRGQTQRYGEGQAPDRSGSLMYADVSLGGQWFALMDSAREHAYAFNEAVSLLVPCDSQAEIDSYWAKLAADPSAGQCGWLKDKFGVSWQVWPRALGRMMSSPDQAAVKRVTEAFLKMRKFDLAKLDAAFKG